MLLNLFLTVSHVATPPPILGTFTQALLPSSGLAAVPGKPEAGTLGP